MIEQRIGRGLLLATRAALDTKEVGFGETRVVRNITLCNTHTEDVAVTIVSVHDGIEIKILDKLLVPAAITDRMVPSQRGANTVTISLEGLVMEAGERIEGFASTDNAVHYFISGKEGVEAILSVLEADLAAIAGTINDLVESDFTPESWAAVTAAEAMPGKTRAQIFAKTNALTEAHYFLIGQTAANALAASKATVEGLTEADYTAVTWAEVETALALPETTNEEVLAKETAIDAAVAGLITVIAADDLQTAKDAAGALTESDYTEASWADLETALALPETTDAEVVTKTTAINNAIAALVTV